VQETYTYDSYGRLENRVSNISTNTNVLTDTLTYESGTARVSSLRSKSRGNYDVTHSYSYDNNGNIKTDNTALYDTSYVYDTANQLIRENNEAAGKTWVWTYDDAGNITSRKEYAYNTGTLSGTATTVNYGYSTSTWGDLLTSFKGKTVYSDAIGNITSITGYRSYSWEHGRQLKQSTFNGSTWNYLYNADGMRYKRTSGNAAYTYYYNGDLLRYVDYDSNTTDSSAAAKLYFVLDASGKPIEVSYRPEGSTTTSFYYYVHNLQGDVEALVDYSTGNAVVWYTYDAWGNVLSAGGSLANTLGKLNPFRYRSYIYDSESKLYYLQSRYYDPEIGRFINADSYALTYNNAIGANMYAYCLNNPVVGYDPTGHSPKTWIKGFVGNLIKTVDQKLTTLYSSKESGTSTVGINGSAAFGISGSISVGVTFDNQGHIGLIITGALGGGTPSAALSGFVTSTTAPDIFKQRGFGMQTGGSVTLLGATVGYEHSMFQDSDTGEVYQGKTVMGGPGGPLWAELHGEASYSLVFGFNVQDFLSAAYNKLMEW